MNSSNPNAEPNTPEEETLQSIKETQQPEEMDCVQTAANESDSDDKDHSDEEELSDADDDSDDDETNVALQRRFTRSRAPSPEDPSLRNGHALHRRVTSEMGTSSTGRRVEGITSLSVRSSPPASSSVQSAGANGVLNGPSPSLSDANAPSSESAADADSEYGTDG